jgi:hypothetical protein
LAYRLGIWRNSKSAIASAAKISLQRCPIEPWGVAGSMAWAVVVTKPSLERRAAKHLKRQGLEVYLPVFVDAYRRRRIMFPRYLFMKIVPGWQRAYRTEGVSSVLLSGLAPAQIAHKFIQKLKRSENRKWPLRPLASRSSYKSSLLAKPCGCCVVSLLTCWQLIN